MRSILEQMRLLSLNLEPDFRGLDYPRPDFRDFFLPLDPPPGVCGWEPVVLAAHANPFIDRSHQGRKCTKAAKPAQKFLL